MVLELILLSMILFLGLALVVSADYMKSIIIISLISVIAAVAYLAMHAPDVALTEAAVGVCASSCILLLGLRYLAPEKHPAVPSLKQLAFTAVVFILVLIILSLYSLDLHQYGDASAILKDGASAYYLANIEKDIGIKSLVTAILASYRGMDTFCETLVVVTAGICVMFILKRDER
jgi:multicomponent Na+:H+ antiporter subunit B